MKRHILIIVSVTLLVLFSAAVLWLYMPAGKSFVKNKIISAAENATGLRISIDEFRTNYFSHASLIAISAQSSETNSDAYINRITVNYRLLPVFTSTVRIDSIISNHLEITLQHIVFNNLIPTEQTSESSGRRKWTVDIGYIRIDDANIEYTNPEIQLRLLVNQMAIRYAVEDSFHANIKNIESSFRETDLSQINLDVSGRVTDQGIRLSRLTLNGPSSTLFVSGIIGTATDSTRYRAELDGTLSQDFLGVMEQFLPMSVNQSLQIDTVQVFGSMDITKEQITYAGTLNIPRFSFDTLGFQRFEAEISGTPERVNISRLRTEFQSVEDTLHVTGLFDWQQKFITIDATCSLSSSAYIKHLLNINDIGFDSPVRVSFSGTLPYSNPVYAQGKGQIILTEPKAAIDSLSPIQVDLTADNGQVNLIITQQPGSSVNRLTLQSSLEWPLSFSGNLSAPDITQINQLTHADYFDSLNTTFSGTLNRQADSLQFNLDGTLIANGKYTMSDPIQLDADYSIRSDSITITNGRIQFNQNLPTRFTGSIRMASGENAAGQIILTEPPVLHTGDTHPIIGTILLTITGENDSTYNTSLELNDISISRWASFVSRENLDLDGIVNSRHSINFGTGSVSGAGSISVNDLHLAQVSVDSVRIDHTMDENGVTIERGRTYSELFTADIQGFVPYDSSQDLDVQASGKDWPLSAANQFLPSDLFLRGSLTADARLYGSYDSIQVGGNVSVDSGFVQWINDKPPVENISGDITFQGRTFNVNNLEFRYDSYPVNINGNGTLSPTFDGMVNILPAGNIAIAYRQPADSADIALNDIPLDILKNYLPESIRPRGSLSAQVNVNGLSSGFPQVYSSGNVFLESEESDSPRSLSWNAATVERMLMIENVSMETEGGKIQASGHIPLGDDSPTDQPMDSMAFDIGISEFPLTALNRFVTTIQVDSGYVDANFTLHHDSTALSMNGFASMEKIFLRDAASSWSIDHGNLSLNFIKNQMILNEVSAVLNDYPLEMNGQLIFSRNFFRTDLTGTYNQNSPFTVQLYHDSPNDSLDGRMSLSGFTLSTVLEMLNRPRDIGGQANVVLDISGSRVQPRFTLTGDVENLLFENIPFPTARFRASYAEERVSLDTLLLSNQEAYIRGSGYTATRINLMSFNIDSVAEETSLSLQARNFTLESIGMLSSGESTLSGLLNADLDYEKIDTETDIRGYVDLSGINTALPYFEQTIRNGNLRTEFQNNTIDIVEGRLPVNGGIISISGNISVSPDNPLQYDLMVQNESLTLERSGEVSLGISPSQLRLITKTGQPTLLTGNIEINSFEYTKPIHNVQPLSLLASRTIRPARLPEQALQDIRLDVGVQAVETARVDNNLAEIDFTTDMQITGPLFQPRYTGRVVSQQGNIQYLGRNFQVEKGTLYFEGTPGLNPNMNISATTVVPSYENIDNIDYTITLSITNTLQSPMVQLSAEPPTRPQTNEALTQSDIIGILAVGRPRELFSSVSGEGNLSQFLLRQASRISSERIASAVEYQVANLFDLDRVAIEGNLFQLSGSNAPTFTAVKNISPRLTLTYSTAIGQSNMQGVRINYELLNNLYIVTETNQELGYGVDLKYKITFK